MKILNVSWQHVFVAQKVSQAPACQKTMVSRSREMVLPLNSALMTPDLECCIQLKSSEQEEWTRWNKSRGCPQRLVRGLEHICCEDRLRELELSSLGQV